MGLSSFSSFNHSWLLILFLVRIHQRYRDLNTELIPEDFTALDVQPKLKYKFLQQLPELKVRQLKLYRTTSGIHIINIL